MRRIRHPAATPIVCKALITADERIWSSLACDDGIVYRREGPVSAGARLPWELLFAIECQYCSLEKWLNDHARVTTRAWYRSPIPEAEIESLLRQLTGNRLPLPLPLDVLAARMNADERALKTAICLSGTHRLYCGQVVEIPLRTRTPRAIRLHRILAGTHAGEVVPTRQLCGSIDGN